MVCIYDFFNYFKILILYNILKYLYSVKIIAFNNKFNKLLKYKKYFFINLTNC